MFAKIIATGSYLPKKILTNDELAKTVDTSNDWIISRTELSNAILPISRKQLPTLP